MMILVVGSYAVFSPRIANMIWRFMDATLHGHFYDRESFVRRHVLAVRIVGGAMVAIGAAVLVANNA